MDWIYRFSSNDSFPEPLEEITALAELEEEDKQPYLLLNDREAPPMSAANSGDRVALCTSCHGELLHHATATIAGDVCPGSTPQDVQFLYGQLDNRCFCLLRDIELEAQRPLDETILAKQDQVSFLRGQATARKIDSGRPPWNTSQRAESIVTHHEPVVRYRCVLPISQSDSHCFIGLDPTAGGWDSKMTKGVKDMPSFGLCLNNSRLYPIETPLRQHTTNDDFWNRVRTAHATSACIDGPCYTNGPRLLPNVSDWDGSSPQGQRDGELQLSRAGVKLFWTTRNTVLGVDGASRFDGASRWIARSLVLFSESHPNGIPAIETHPHGAFTFLWRLLGNGGSLPKKTSRSGRKARIDLLEKFIDGITPEMFSNHDDVDAACAALIMALHWLGLTSPFGTIAGGGQIWMPDLTKLSGYLTPVPL